MSVEKLITDNIDVWTSAIKTKSASGRGSSNKLELYGIKKLRELILELAVRGKLVPQDPTDEPASKLLERIAAEKEQLIKDKKIKKQKPLLPITQDEELFDLALGWTWCRLKDVSSYIQRGKGPKYAEEGNVRVISQKCIQNSGFTTEPARYVLDESLKKYQSERYLQESDLLWNSTGTGTVGRANVLPFISANSLVADSHVTVIRPLLANSRFLWCYISSPTIQARIEPTHEASLVSGSTKQVELNTSAVQNLCVPLAPLNEQIRIIERVGELMALCDQLESQTEASIEAHQTLVKTLLETLTNAKDADELNDSWQRISEHFDVLFTTDDSIDQLKQTILQLAVMGKLVKQDPNDEPASKLLEHIAAEKEQLIKDKKVKKQKPLPPISDDDKPFDVPNGWAHCRLGNVIHVSSGKNLTSSKMVKDGGIPVFGGNGITGYHDEANIVEKSLVIGRVGYYCGSIHVTPKKAWVTDNAFITYFSKHNIDIDFLALLLKATDLKENENATAQPVISGSKIYPIVVALPPIHEQKRIVAKVDELMALCDALKSKLHALQEIQLNVSDTLVKQAS